VLLADNEELVDKYTCENNALISKLKLRQTHNLPARVELLANPQPASSKDQDKLLTE